MNVRQVIPPDAIPSVDDPAFVETYGGDPDDEVIVVELGHEARAYQVRYLHYHEIVNDVFGVDESVSDENADEDVRDEAVDDDVCDDTVGDEAVDDDEGENARPVAVTWCPLCASAVVYDARVGGKALEFGVSGKLADDDLVMYDRETGSEWKQSSGVCIAGHFEGRRLSALPATLTTWEAFERTHPDGVVLAPPGGDSEASGRGPDPEPVDYDVGPYEAYFDREGFGLGAHRGTGGRSWDRDDLDAKALVLGIDPADLGHPDADPVGFPLTVVEAAGGVVTACVGVTDVAVFATSEGIHAFETAGESFEPVGDGSHFRADGATWHGATGESDDGRTLARIPARRLFAFAWQDDHGPDRFYGFDG